MPIDPPSRMSFPLNRGSLILLLTLALCAFRTSAQQLPEPFSNPPSLFSAEDDKFPHAVALPDCVRQLLASDKDVTIRLEHQHLSPEQLPADWFTASEQDFGHGNGAYLVVMGASVMRGANINPFWIFRQSPKACDLLLSVGAHDVKVLGTRTNGLPDLKTDAMTAVYYFENRYTFDGRKYEVVERRSQPIGVEIPRNLSRFATRKPLVQAVGQNPEPILSEARAWLWRRWLLRRQSDLKVTLHSKEGDETTTTYFMRRTDDHLEVIIQVHRILADRAPHSGARRPLVEDEILVATDIERRLALEGNLERRTKLPADQGASPDSYELHFSDESGNNVAVL